MDNQPTPPQDGQPRQQQVNLQQIAQQFMAGLQRHFDMLSYNLAARGAVTEEKYRESANRIRIMPAAPLHLNFEQMQAYSRDLMLRQVLGDAMNLFNAGLNNAHFFLALIKATGGTSQVTPEAQKAAGESQQAFIAAPLDEKFNRLEKDYGVMCELEDTITSLGFALQALLQQNGVVREPQVDDNGELVVELKTLDAEQIPMLQAGDPAKLTDRRVVFKEGEVVTFSEDQFQEILITIAGFADSLFKSVANYARSAQEGS